MKNRFYFFGILLITSLLYGVGCRRAGVWLVKENVPAQSDVMVLLMGSFPERVMQAADLFRDGRADRLIIVQESMGPYELLESRGADIISSTEQARNSAVALGIPGDSITVLPGDARSTLTEAAVVRDYLRLHSGVDTLVLVSSPSHMRRASMIFKEAFRNSGTPVYIGCSPSAYSDFDPKHWWRRKEDIQMVLSEFVKIGSFKVFEKRELKTGNQRNN